MPKASRLSLEVLSMSKATGMQKIIVDLQSNGGGDALLATDLFKHASLPSHESSAIN
jgi:hypothetical protein